MMKISKCKKELARIISENGGWVDCEAIFAAMDGNGDLFGYSGKPQWTVSHGHWYGHTITCWFFSPVVIKNHHQTILSREEYFNLYPDVDHSDEQKAEIRWVLGKNIYATPTAHDCMKMLKEKWHYAKCDCDECLAFYCKPNTPTELSIEQLAADYRNAKDYAERKQKEADDAKAVADAALGDLERAGEAFGLVIGVAKPESELVITDWRDLLERDVIWFGGDDEQAAGEYSVLEVERADYGGNRAIRIDTIGEWYWIDVTDDWKFIRRP